MITVVIFSGMTFLNGFAQTPTQFAVMRFIAGLGIGGVMPNVVALMTEYMPRKIRSTMVAVMFSGYSVGGMSSAFLGMYLMPSYGWQSVFFVAGIPLLLLPLIWIFLPETVGFLLKEGRKEEAGRLARARRAVLYPRRRRRLSPRHRQGQERRAGRAVPERPSGQHADVLGRLLQLPADGVCARLLAAQADEQGRLRARLQPELPARAQLRRHLRRDRWRLAGGPLPPAPGADHHVRDRGRCRSARSRSRTT